MNDVNVMATVWSFAYILAVIGLAFVAYRFFHLGAEGARKFIHILVSLWVFILVNMYDSYAWAMVGPVAFMIINFIAVYGGLASHLGMGNRKRDNGLIYYPFSLAVMVTLMYKGFLPPYAVIASTLMMGFGDGFAALVGTCWGRHRYVSFGGSKSLEGSIAMFVVSLAVMAIATPCPWYWVVAVASIATVLESFTPLGFDNITVPLVSAVIMGLVR